MKILLVHTAHVFRRLVSLTGAKLLSLVEAIDAADVVVLAVPVDFYTTLPLKLLSGKVVVDVSNRNSMHKKMTV